MEFRSDMRRDLTLFLLGPAVVALAAAAWFHLQPWPVFHPSQAGLFAWPATLGYLAAGAWGVAVSTRVGCASAPRLGDAAAWRRVVLWGLGVGLAYGAVALAELLFTPAGAHSDAINAANGITWFNVGLPWSLLHYAHASVVTECAFRLAAICVPTWLISTLLLKGRLQAPVFWTCAVLAAFVEPALNWIGKHISPLHLSPLETFQTLEALVWQLAYAWLLRRFGWPAPILARFGFYLLFRVSAGYFFPPTSAMYPGPH